MTLSRSNAFRVEVSGPVYGLNFPGDGTQRRMLYWHNPFPIYDATYIFKLIGICFWAGRGDRSWTPPRRGRCGAPDLQLCTLDPFPGVP
jgi:hypothetical protein